MILEVGLVFFTICLIIAVLAANDDQWGAAIGFLIIAALALLVMFFLMTSLDAIHTNILGSVALGVVGLIITFFLALWMVAAFIAGLVALS